MTIADRYGLPLTTESAEAAAHVQDGMDRLLAYAPGADASFGAAIALDERLAVAHAGVALVALLYGDPSTARAAITRAANVVAGTTRRERQHVETLVAIVDGDAVRGLALAGEHLSEFPCDALVANQASSAIGFGGAADREKIRAAFLEQLAPAYGDDWWFLSALGFVYHEVGRLDESERLSARSLTRHPANANASHNLAHVYYERGDYDDGAAFLDDWLRTYERDAPYRCHLAWHVALFDLQRGHTARALDTFARDIRRPSNGRLGMIDGAALLWRLRLYDHAADVPWAGVAQLATRVSRPGFVFGEIHAALAYASSGDDAALARVVDNLRALDAKGHPTAGTVALPIVLGSVAFAAADYAGAVAQLEPVLDAMHRIGGSHAQWELFEETLVVAYLRLGRHADAVRLVRRRLDRRPSPLDVRWLADAERARNRSA